MQRWQHLTWKWIAGAIAAVVILSATLMGLFRLFAPLVPGYREQVQAWASQALGRPVNIAAMGAQWGLFGPEVTLEKVEILSKDHQRVVATAREIRLGVTFGALLHGRFSNPNRIILIQPQLVLDRDADGNFGIRGLEGSFNLNHEQTDWHQMAADIFAQNAEVIIRHGEVALVDMHTPITPLVFSDIGLKINNNADSHNVTGRLLLPSALGRSLSFASRIHGQGLNPEVWEWQADVQGTALNVPRLLSYWAAYSGRFSGGLIDLRAALSGQGARVNQAQVTFSAHQVIVVGDASTAAGFNAFAGTLNWTRSTAGWILSGSDIQLRHNQDIWPASHFTLQYANQQPAGSVWSGNANFLRLQDIVTLATWLPKSFSTKIARLLRLSPKGDATDVDFQAQWNGNFFRNWSLRGRFIDLSLHADGDVPGFSGLAGELTANQDDGTLQLTGKHASATFPHLFRGTLAATALGAHVQFHHDAEGWRISTNDLSVANADAQAYAHGSFLLPADGSSPIIDLEATAANVNVRNKSVYLPVGIMPKQVVSWLDTAVVSGEVASGSVTLRGELRDFPFDNSQGLFDIRFHLIHGVLDYAAGWPRVADLEADVEFKNQGMNVTVQHGMLLGDNINGTTARFADLRQGILEIKGTARGTAQTALAFLRTGPLHVRFGHYLDALKVSGRSDVSLNLVLPVEHVEQFKLSGRTQLHDMSVGAANLPIWRVSQLNGEVAFTADGVSADKLHGMLLNQPVTISLRPNGKQGTTLVTARGGVSAAMLSVALPAPFHKTLSGIGFWQLTGSLSNSPAVRNTGLSLTLTSNLEGLGMDLPAPFGKPADTAMPLSATLDLVSDNQLLLQVRYANTMNSLYRFMNENGDWRFDRGDLNFGTAKPFLPATVGLTLTGTLPEFSLDAWKPYSAQSSASSSELLPPLLRGMDINVAHFSGFGEEIDNLQVQLDRDNSDWKLGLMSVAIAGQINLPYRVDLAHPVVADMQRVTLTRKAAQSKNTSFAQFNPHDIPPLHITIKQLHYDGVMLDNVHAELEPQLQGVNLKVFSITNLGFSATGSGQWINQPSGGQTSALSMQMQSVNVEKTLQAFGYAPGITGDQGELQADLTWQGGPFADIPPTLNGKLHIKLKDGRLLEVKPGAGRLFGLLSINALPRRLLLNFSDVLGKGFAYDSIQGDFLMERGDAYTSNLVVSGPAAKIHVIGRIGLVKHDFDEALIVDTSVGATLPVVGALAASSLGVGAVLFILTEIFKKPLIAAGEIRYRLTGTWDNPVLAKVVASKPAANRAH